MDSDPHATEPLPDTSQHDHDHEMQVQTTEESSWLVRVFTLAFYFGFVLLIAWFAGGRNFLVSHPAAVGIAFAFLVLVVTLPITTKWYRTGSAQRRVGLLIFGLMPLTVLFFVAVFLVPPRFQTAVLRTVFLVVVCLLPALLYYLFIVTKKYSLLNEFVINLNRLGLIDPSKLPKELMMAGLENETNDERKNRIYTYIQKFEAVYGAIPTNLGGMVVEPTDIGLSSLDLKNSAKDQTNLYNVLTLDTTVPVVIATVLIVLGWLVTLPPWQGRLSIFTQSAPIQQVVRQAQRNQTQPQTQAQLDNGELPEVLPTPDDEAKTWLAVFTPVSEPVRFAFVGAYFFALQMLFRRYVRRDLRASAYVAVSLRIILAVIGIWIVSEAIEIAPPQWIDGAKSKQAIEQTLLVLGFVIGVFPRVAWQVVQAAIKRLGSIVVPSLQTQLPLSDLDGLTVWHEARFEEEDIENIPNMATADVVDLLINTRFPPDRLIDWMDQAILYTALGPEDTGGIKEKFRVHGIRTATGLVEGYNQSQIENDQDSFESIIPCEGRNPIRSLVDTVVINPNLKLIQTWKGLLPHSMVPALNSNVLDVNAGRLREASPVRSA